MLPGIQIRPKGTASFPVIAEVSGLTCLRIVASLRQPNRGSGLRRCGSGSGPRRCEPQPIEMVVWVRVCRVTLRSTLVVPVLKRFLQKTRTTRTHPDLALILLCFLRGADPDPTRTQS